MRAIPPITPVRQTARNRAPSRWLGGGPEGRAADEETEKTDLPLAADIAAVVSEAAPNLDDLDVEAEADRLAEEHPESDASAEMIAEGDRRPDRGRADDEPGRPQGCPSGLTRAAPRSWPDRLSCLSRVLASTMCKRAVSDSPKAAAGRGDGGKALSPSDRLEHSPQHIAPRQRLRRLSRSSDGPSCSCSRSLGWRLRSGKTWR